MQAQLSQKLWLEELTKALNLLANCKLLGPDDTVAKLFKAMWPIICQDYLNMIRSALIQGSLPENVIAGLIILLHKDGPKDS